MANTSVGSFGVCHTSCDRSRTIEGAGQTSGPDAGCGFLSQGIDACNKLLIMDELLDSGPFFLTGNTDTVYCGGFLDLEQDGPTVVEIPPGCGPGDGERRVVPVRDRHGRPRA